MEACIIILDRKYAVGMSKNSNNIKRTRYISGRVHFLTNGEKYKMHMIDWCKVGLQMSDIATENVGWNELNTRIEYIIVRIEN